MAQPKSPYTAQQEQELMLALWDPAIADDLEAYVLFKYPWGKEGTPLAGFKGPRNWQRDELQAITQHIKDNRAKVARGEMPEMYRSAKSSGRGPGKSALVGWLTEWMQDTRLGSSVIMTANTESQLKSRTWAELGKWQTLGLNGHWFERGALHRKPVEWFEQLLTKQLKIDTGYYYAQAQLWSEENPDAFAGLHNHNGVMLIFDEASGIPAPIWKVSEGFFTEPVVDRYWFAFSNPRRNTGAFFECFHKNRNYWRTQHIDSRDVEGTDISVLQAIIDQYGEDSDEARVEVKGEFPLRGEDQLIGYDIIQDAAERELCTDADAPLVLGVDVGRGGDPTVLRWRQGRDARSIPPVRFKIRDDMQTAYKVAEWIDKTNPDGVMIDAGQGTGVIDRLKEMGYKTHEIWFGGGSPEPAYANQRTWMWFQMRDWLSGGCIDDDTVLKQDLAGPEKRYFRNKDATILESKDDMRKRGLDSPNDGDALALTFAKRIARRDLRVVRAGRGPQSRVALDVDYSVFGG
jgi:hypothetical protein